MRRERAMCLPDSVFHCCAAENWISARFENVLQPIGDSTIFTTSNVRAIIGRIQEDLYLLFPFNALPIAFELTLANAFSVHWPKLQQML
jgi:hypothetical protein